MDAMYIYITFISEYILHSKPCTCIVILFTGYHNNWINKIVTAISLFYLSRDSTGELISNLYASISQ